VGFWDVQLKDRDTILVHTSFVYENNVLVVQGYEWERIPLVESSVET